MDLSEKEDWEVFTSHLATMNSTFNHEKFQVIYLATSWKFSGLHLLRVVRVKRGGQGKEKNLKLLHSESRTFMSYNIYNEYIFFLLTFKLRR